MIRKIAFIVLLIHAIGHLQGVVVGLGLKDFGKWNAQSWLLSNWLSPQVQNILCVLLFVLTALLTFACALSFQGWAFTGFSWKALGLYSGILSVVSMALFPHAFAMFFNYIGAIGVNLALFYAYFISDEWLAE